MASEKPVGVVRAIYIRVYVDALEVLYRESVLQEEATISIIIDIREYIREYSGDIRE